MQTATAIHGHGGLSLSAKVKNDGEPCAAAPGQAGGRVEAPIAHAPARGRAAQGVASSEPRRLRTSYVFFNGRVKVAAPPGQQLLTNRRHGFCAALTMGRFRARRGKGRPVHQVVGQVGGGMQPFSPRLPWLRVTVMPPSFTPVTGLSWPPTISAKMRSLFEGIDGVEQPRLFVFLVVFVVGQGLAFHQRDQKPIRWPTTRSVLPRASSGTSGFFLLAA